MGFDRAPVDARDLSVSRLAMPRHALRTAVRVRSAEFRSRRATTPSVSTTPPHTVVLTRPGTAISTSRRP